MKNRASKRKTSRERNQPMDPLGLSCSHTLSHIVSPILSLTSLLPSFLPNWLKLSKRVYKFSFFIFSYLAFHSFPFSPLSVYFLYFKSNWIKKTTAPLFLHSLPHSFSIPVHLLTDSHTDSLSCLVVSSKEKEQQRGWANEHTIYNNGAPARPGWINNMISMGDSHFVLL